jgi:hypothetical protein
VVAGSLLNRVHNIDSNLFGYHNSIASNYLNLFKNQFSHAFNLFGKAKAKAKAKAKTKALVSINVFYKAQNHQP